MNICVIIPAAGRSERFGESDKLSQDLGGRPLLIRTVEAFAKCDEVRSIVVAGPPDAIDDFRERFGPTLGFHGASVVTGGRDSRAETVRNALEAVPEEATHVAVHDAARPGVSAELLARVFEAAGSASAVVPAVPIAGTVKRGASEASDLAGEEDEAGVLDSILGDAGRTKIQGRAVVETIPRDGLYEVQTPQVFDRDLIRRAYDQGSIDEVTDDAMLVERLGEPVYLVDGDPCNLKVTTPQDLRLIRAVLGMKPPSERPTHLRF